MICPKIQVGNRKSGLKVKPASSTIVQVANGGSQKGGVLTLFAGGLYNLSTAISSLQTAEYAYAVLGINPYATKSVLVEGSPLTTTVSSLTVLAYNPTTGAITIDPNLANIQELAGLYVEDVNGEIYEIDTANLTPTSPISPSTDTITIIDGPTETQATGDPFFPGQTISILGQGLDVAVGGHKYNVHKLTVASTSPGGYYNDTEIDLTTSNIRRSTIAVDEALISDELGINGTTTMYVHWRGSTYEVTDVDYASPNVLIEIKNGPITMADGEEFWVAPYQVAPEYDDDPEAPAKVPCVPDGWVPLAAILIYDGMSSVTVDDIYDLREDFNLITDDVSVNFTASDVTITGDQSNIVLAQMYLSTTDPKVTNDSADSAGLGLKFQIGALWMKTGVTPALYVCANSTPLAADWQQIL